MLVIADHVGARSSRGPSQPPRGLRASADRGTTSPAARTRLRCGTGERQENRLRITEIRIASSTMQPSLSKVLRCPSTTTRTAGSTGSPPRSGHHAMRVPWKLRLRARETRKEPKDRTRVPRVRPGHHAQQPRYIGHRASHRPFDAEIEKRKQVRGRRAPAPHSAASDDVVEVAGVPQRAAQVAAVGDREHSGCECGSGAAARAPAVLVGSKGLTSFRTPCCRYVIPCRARERLFSQLEWPPHFALARPARSPPPASRPCR